MGQPSEAPGTEPPEQSQGTDPKMLELLVCPLTKTSLDYDATRQELISRVARLAFPVRDGVPMMTIEVARKLDDDEAAVR
jgi:uncharacterized protein YbaR (Trm112 family)